MTPYERVRTQTREGPYPKLMVGVFTNSESPSPKELLLFHWLNMYACLAACGVDERVFAFVSHLGEGDRFAFDKETDTEGVTSGNLRVV